MWQLCVCMMVSMAFADDRWVWGRDSKEPEDRSVPSNPSSEQQFLPATTFRPTLFSNRSALRHRHPLNYHPVLSRIFSHDFEEPHSPIPRVKEEGIVNPEVALLDYSSGATLAVNDKYTTLDRLQRERGPAPSFPIPPQADLGGLHPDEVFYIDNDLLILKGGGFHSETPRRTQNSFLDDTGNVSDSETSVASPTAGLRQDSDGSSSSLILGRANPLVTRVETEQIDPSSFSVFVEG